MLYSQSFGMPFCNVNSVLAIIGNSLINSDCTEVYDIHFTE